MSERFLNSHHIYRQSCDIACHVRLTEDTQISFYVYNYSFRSLCRPHGMYVFRAIWEFEQSRDCANSQIAWNICTMHTAELSILVGSFPGILS